MTHSAQRNTTELCCWTFTWTWDPVLLWRPPLAQRAWSQWREQLTGKRLPSEGEKRRVGEKRQVGDIFILRMLDAWKPPPQRHTLYFHIGVCSVWTFATPAKENLLWYLDRLFKGPIQFLFHFLLQEAGGFCLLHAGGRGLETTIVACWVAFVHLRAVLFIYADHDHTCVLACI